MLFQSFNIDQLPLPCQNEQNVQKKQDMFSWRESLQT